MMTTTMMMLPFCAVLWPYENHSQLQLTVSLLAEQTQILSENRLGQQNFEFRLCNASLAAAFTFAPHFPWLEFSMNSPHFPPA